MMTSLTPNITPITPISGIGASLSTGAMTNAADPNSITPSFGQTLEAALNNVNSLQLNSDDMAKSFAAGKTSDIHSVMIAAQQATISLDLAMQVRNKVTDAYQEVMRMTM
jgi:flagellar hook-basal body complex protein FliE